MGYYARGAGDFTFSGSITQQEIKIVESVFVEAGFDLDIQKPARSDGSSSYEISVWIDSKFYETEILAMLDGILCPALTFGELRYQGEDDGIWRYILRDGEWVEQSGVIVYE